MATAKKRGRPSKRTPELIDEICERISTSALGVAHWCKKFEHWPDARKIYEWLEKDEEFRQKYARAKENQAEFMEAEIIAIADESAADFYEDEDGIERADHDHINRSRLRVDTRKWLMSKLLPKKYGDRIQQDISGAGSLVPVINLQVTNPQPTDKPKE